MASSPVLSGDQYCNEIFAKVFDDRNACPDRSIPVIIEAPAKIGNHVIKPAIFKFKQAGRYLDSSAAYFESIGDQGGFSFCIDDSYLDSVSFELAYGESECQGFVYAFSIKNFSELGTNEKVYSVPSKYKPAGEEGGDCNNWNGVLFSLSLACIQMPKYTSIDDQ